MEEKIEMQETVEIPPVIVSKMLKHAMNYPECKIIIETFIEAIGKGGKDSVIIEGKMFLKIIT